MGRLERKIKKQLKKDAEPFEVWQDRNQPRLNGFEKYNNISEQSNGGDVLVKERRIWIPVFAFLCGIIICLAILLPVLFNKNNSDFDMTFGDERVYTSMILEEDLQSITESYPFINKMQITEQGELRLRDDDSLVFTIIDGEIDTGDNYYLLKVQIEHNKNYEFGYKSVYRNLKNQTDVNGIVVTYGQGINDPSDLFVYFLRLEYPKGQVIYIEAHCFENDISYILNEFI